jgi:hypothetical protein
LINEVVVAREVLLTVGDSVIASRRRILLLSDQKQADICLSNDGTHNHRKRHNPAHDHS